MSATRHDPNERLPVLDLLRGLAILMILPANLPYFSLPSGAQMEPGATLGNPSEKIAVAVVLLLVQGKFIALLSMLFGFGMRLQAERAGTGPFAGRYARRMFVLLAIGLGHFVLLWWGDILTWYALTGLLALAFVRCRVRTLLGWAAAIFAAALLALAAWVGVAGPVSVDAAADDPISRYLSVENETRIYTQGSYLQRVAHRGVLLIFMTLAFLFGMAWTIVPLFLVGIALARSGKLHDVARHRPFFRTLAAWGVAIGLPLQALAAYAYLRGSDGLEMLLGTAGAPALAFAYMAGICLWSASGRAPRLQSALRAVGRLALSNYLLQTAVCTFVFYGLGWFGRLDRVQSLLLLPPLWIAQVALSVLWLRRFRMGPVEWLWRTLASGQRQPLRRATAGKSLTGPEPSL